MQEKRRVTGLIIIAFTIVTTVVVVFNFYRTNKAVKEIQVQYTLPLGSESRSLSLEDGQVPPSNDQGPVTAPITPDSARSEPSGQVSIDDLTQQENESIILPPTDMANEEDSGFDDEQEISSEYSEYMEFAAKHEKFLAEYQTMLPELEAAKAEIPHVVDVLNSLSADVQKEFLEKIKAMYRDAAVTAGVEDMRFLEESMESFVEALIESGFEPRY